MKYVVTGGAGFIGSNLVDRLVLTSNEVYVIDNFSSGKKTNCNNRANYFDLDLSDENNYKKFLEILCGTDTVFHTAAKARVQQSIANPVLFEKNNTLGLVNILKASVDMKVRRFVYSSSSSVYGINQNLPLQENDSPQPMSPYGAQKLYGEIICKTFSKVYGIETVCLRYFNVYGEKQNTEETNSLVLGIFLNQKKNNLPLTIRGDGNQKRDFTYVGDVVEANILASSSKLVGKGESINIGRGKSISINELAKMISNNFVFVDNVLEPKNNLSNSQKAFDLLGWKSKTDIKDWIIKADL